MSSYRTRHRLPVYTSIASALKVLVATVEHAPRTGLPRVFKSARITANNRTPMLTTQPKQSTGFDLEQRVAGFASRAIAVCEALPNRTGAAHIKDQLFRSSTSVAANYASLMLSGWLCQ